MMALMSMIPAGTRRLASPNLFFDWSSLAWVVAGDMASLFRAG